MSNRAQNITVELESKNTTTKAKINGHIEQDPITGNLKIIVSNTQGVDNLRIAAEKLKMICEADFSKNNNHQGA